MARNGIESQRIFVVGSGVVGAATGRGFRAVGHEVTFVDTSAVRVRELRQSGLDARGELDLSGAPDAFVLLTLPTPNLGAAYDLAAFTAGTEAVGRALGASSAHHTVVVRSTVPPGTTEDLVRPLLEKASGKQAGNDFGLASNPEFLRAASAEQDFAHPWMTVIGSRDTATLALVAALLAPFGGEMRTFDDPATAEFIKCAHNIYNATKISFWNEMWQVAQRAGVDAGAVSATVARSAEGSVNPLYGIRGGAPYGGVCLPKDTNGFLGFAAELGMEMPLLRAVVDTNERLERLVAAADIGGTSRDLAAGVAERQAAVADVA
jgi:UDPglucose 6-dehydrogenase